LERVENHTPIWCQVPTFFTPPPPSPAARE
jgi:hypothetical protein